MRTYYIFSINKELNILTKDSPYMLYKSFEAIYKADKEEIYNASFLFEQISKPIDKNKINNKLTKDFKDNDFYMLNNNVHKYYNRYKDENCELQVKSSYIICRSNSTRPILLTKIKNNDLFVCDFNNSDYFWLDEIYC